MTRRIVHDHSHDGIDRRGFLECMAWAGSGVVWTAAGGVLTSQVFGQTAKIPAGELHFVQISDTHIGFNKAANPDVTATLQAAVARVNALPQAPEFIIHTGDLSHSAKAGEFDTLDQLLKGVRAPQVFYVPGEHDTANDDGKQYLERYGKSALGRGWFSFNHKDVHFVGLSNVAVLEGLGRLGDDQIEWLKKDLEGQPSSRPVVVFAHIPLWSVYPEWGWGTGDGEQALALLKRFGSVTVLNGHIHQVMRKVEGRVTFHTAMSTAFPQPAPGAAAAPGPMKVADDKLRAALGVTEVTSHRTRGNLAIVDETLEAA
jgi:3',5'-cyclic AMP phosphodiesterase CpdA